MGSASTGWFLGEFINDLLAVSWIVATMVAAPGDAPWPRGVGPIGNPRAEGVSLRSYVKQAIRRSLQDVVGNEEIGAFSGR
jgi:hypothetical protein